MPVPKEFFSPKSVAIIGASRFKGKVGHEILRNFVKGKYKGKVFPVNPKAKKILGLDSYPSVSEIKGKIDLAVITVPAAIVPDVLRECVEKGIPAVILITSGFGELGVEGKKKEQELLRIVANTKTRLLGPNCMGIIDTATGFDTNFNPEPKQLRPPKGNIAFITQSGAVGSTIIDWLAGEGIGISKFISQGNQIDIDESDFISYLKNDKETKVITAYIEGVKNGKKFLNVCRETSKTKPIIVLKAGKTSAGTRAVTSHTGALAGSAEVYSGAFRQASVVEVKGWEELFDSATAFATQPLPAGNKIAIVTDGGGFGVLATDEAERQGLHLPEPSKALTKIMKEKFPPYVSLRNPIDLTGDADTARYEVALDQCLKAKEFDGVIAITLFQLPSLEKDLIDVLIKLNKRHKKPLIVCSTGSTYTQKIIKKLESNGLSVYPTPERAVAAFATMWRYSSLK